MGYTTKEIIELMEKAAQLRVSVEVTDCAFTVKIDGTGRPAAQPAARAVAEKGPGAPATTPPTPPPPAAAPIAEGTVVKAPIVGTFYTSPAPDKAPFVQPGRAVKKGDVLFVIESMKLMNEVTSEWDGVVREILVGNGQAVEYGQPLLILE